MAGKKITEHPAYEKLKNSLRRLSDAKLVTEIDAGFVLDDIVKLPFSNELISHIKGLTHHIDYFVDRTQAFEKKIEGFAYDKSTKVNTLFGADLNKAVDVEINKLSEQKNVFIKTMKSEFDTLTKQAEKFKQDKYTRTLSKFFNALINAVSYLIGKQAKKNEYFDELKGEYETAERTLGINLRNYEERGGKNKELFDCTSNLLEEAKKVRKSNVGNNLEVLHVLTRDMNLASEKLANPGLTAVKEINQLKEGLPERQKTIFEKISAGIAYLTARDTWISSFGKSSKEKSIETTRGMRKEVHKDREPDNDSNPSNTLQK